MRPRPPLETLRTVFGFDAFRDGQAAVIDSLLADKSTLAVFPTGSGKSLCYQLPALYFSGLTLVISPLIALMKDQVEFLQSRNIQAVRLDSSLTWEQTRQVYDGLRSHQQQILFIAPERLSNERFLQTLNRQTIDLLVIDEAHCISEWGHNFRPEYLKLAKMARELAVKRVLALTATATPKVAEDICREFNIKPDGYIHTGFYRPNLTLRFSVCPGIEEKQRRLLARLQQAPAGPTIVYVTLQKTAEAVADFLASEGYDSRAYHAGMQTEARNAVQNWFMASSSAIVVATIAFGMGIDKADIRAVYHYNLPKTIENYSQEIGRAGRDGRPSVCEVFASNDDLITLENFVYGDTPERAALDQFLEFVLAQEPEFDISVYELANRFDIRHLVVKTTLTYLELMGIIESTAPFYAEYRFQPLLPSEQILQKFDQKRAAFLRRLFSLAKKGRTWFTIDVTAAAETLQESRGRLVRALNYLEEQGYLTLKVSGARQGYRLIN
ncbi:MAG: RecQ family ATP-dependent DNA helicase, partial [Anaerolineae bacterium]|nr:RecQ family ATP-dependent DNA helicase [Anaerolineae bacterium]